MIISNNWTTNTPFPLKPPIKEIPRLPVQQRSAEIDTYVHEQLSTYSPIRGMEYLLYVQPPIHSCNGETDAQLNEWMTEWQRPPFHLSCNLKF